MTHKLVELSGGGGIGAVAEAVGARSMDGGVGTEEDEELEAAVGVLGSLREVVCADEEVCEEEDVEVDGELGRTEIFGQEVNVALEVAFACWREGKSRATDGTTSDFPPAVSSTAEGPTLGESPATARGDGR